MHWLQSLDVELFRFINLRLSHPALDAVMPFFSGNPFFIPLVVLAGMLLLWKGGARGRLFLLMLALVVAVGDGFICNTLKDAIGRDRPFLALADVHCLVGKGGSGSMPSSHAANWVSAAMVALVYYRRSVFFMVPLAAVVGFSRVYNGVHYPSDVLVGAILGAGYAVATMWLADAFWVWGGRKWFPLWWARLPSLLSPPSRPKGDAGSEEEEPPLEQPLPKVRGQAPAGFQAPHVTLDAHWVRLGYIWIAAVLFARLVYLGSGTIQLAEDEAYQWLWSKHLALSYFSKPPLIAYTQFLGTSLWGDTAFGVRFFSPVIAAVLGVIMLRFFAREVNARAGFFLLLIVSATPLLAVGSVLMTVDPLSVLFWTAAMVAGWRAVREDATTRDWLWVGLWMGLGFLSKYTALVQWLCWAVFFALWRPARKQLRRPGPYLALLVNLLCALPVLIWNSQRNWITVQHVAIDAGAGTEWHPTLRFLGDFLGAELGLWNPVFFVATVWAALVFWRRNRNQPLLVYCFSMGAPLFLMYLAHSFRSRILPNWIAPSVLPLFCLMVIYWDTRLRLGVTRVKTWLAAGLVFGFTAVILFHDTDLWAKTFGARKPLASLVPAASTNAVATLARELLGEKYLPAHLDPLHRVRDWDDTAKMIGQTREELLLAEGKTTFIIADHYGMVGQLSFYLPAARAAVRDTPLVYCRRSSIPENQFYFWPSYLERKGQNAIYVRELYRKNPIPFPPPAQLLEDFESVEDLGVRNVYYRDKYLLRPLQLFACRGLR